MPEPLRVKDRRVADRGRRLLAGHMLIEIRSQALDGIARGQPGGTVELARLSHLAIGDAGDPPCGLEVITGQRAWDVRRPWTLRSPQMPAARQRTSARFSSSRRRQVFLLLRCGRNLRCRARIPGRPRHPSRPSLRHARALLHHSASAALHAVSPSPPPRVLQPKRKPARGRLAVECPSRWRAWWQNNGRQRDWPADLCVIDGESLLPNLSD